MNKRGLIEFIAKEMDETNTQAERIVNAFLKGVRTGLKKEGGVQLVGFGSFTVRKRKSRKGRNPQTGETITIKASKTVAFRPGKDLKASI